MLVRLARLALLALLFAQPACKPTVHPSDPGIPRAMCEPRCQRDHDCDAQVDVADCEARCERSLSPRDVYDRPDYVAALRDCSLRQSCVADVDGAIRTCMRDAFRRLEPTPAARAYCNGRLQKDATCRVSRSKADDYEHCIDGYKMYSDAIIEQLAECNGDSTPCRAREMCGVDIVGHDKVIEDESYQEKRRAVSVEAAGASTVMFTVTVQSESPRAPLPGVAACMQGTQQCATSDNAGELRLLVPAHAQVAVTFTAPTFRSVLVPFTTTGKNFRTSVNLQSEESVRARYARVGVTMPDPATGALTVKTWSLEAKNTTMEGVSFTVTPASGTPPIYFAPDGAVTTDRKDTSSWGAVAFPGLPPGTAEATAGPADVVCVPGSWSWPSTHPNSVTAPIVAGFVTQVSMQCHR